MQLQTHSREIVRRELAAWILADVLRMGTLLGADAAHRALGNPVPPIPGRVQLDVGGYDYEVKLHQIDIDHFPVGHTVMAMYDYVNEQLFPLGQGFDQFRAEMELVEDFIDGRRSDLFYQFLTDSSHTEDADVANFDAVPTLLNLAQARLKLDSGEALSLDELGALCGLEVKSLRNAMSALGEAKLCAYKVGNDASSSYYAENDEARRWLMLRGFLPTRFREVNAKPGDHPDALHSLMELGGFIAERWAALGKGPDEALKELGWPRSRFDYLNGISGQPQNIDPRDCEDLAKSLAVSNQWFTAQVMRNLYPRQVEMLLRHERPASADQQERQQPSPDIADRVCDRLRFCLHDGAEMFPVRMKNRDSGFVAYRVSEGGQGGNTKEAGQELESDEEMIEAVCTRNMSVRLISADGKRQGLYRRTGRAVRCVELDGQVI